MRVIDVEYDRYLEERHPGQVRLRTLNDCTIWTEEGDPLRLVLVDPGRRIVAVFEYASYSEFQRDCRRILELKDDEGGEGSGVPARLNPLRPVRAAGCAEPIPQPDLDG